MCRLIEKLCQQSPFAIFLCIACVIDIALGVLPNLIRDLYGKNRDIFDLLSRVSERAN